MTSKSKVRAHAVRIGDMLAGPRGERVVAQIKRSGDLLTFVHGSSSHTEVPAGTFVFVRRLISRVEDHDAPVIVHRSESVGRYRR